MIVNGNPIVKGQPRAAPRESGADSGRRQAPRCSEGDARPAPRSWAPESSASGCKSRSRCCGPTRRCATPTSRCWPRGSAPTTWSLIADAYARHCADLFSLEMWGGATFDTSMRFLKESPWQRLDDCCARRCPNILFQMLLRASSAMGYANYPDNVVRGVRQGSGRGGNRRLPHFRRAQLDAEHAGGDGRGPARPAPSAKRPSATRATSSIRKRPKYNLKYYVELAKELEQMGATSWRSRIWRACCKPHAAAKLVKALEGRDRHSDPLPHARHGRRAGGVDPEGGRGGTRHRRRRAGPDVGRHVAAEPQHAGRGAAVHAAGTEPRRGVARRDFRVLARGARVLHAVREPRCSPRGADLYQHEMPGGQYTNLFQQAQGAGLASRWLEVCRVYADVNQLFGDIVKVTPTSKAVGDMALFMVANDLSCARA